jgi:spermidine synthase
MFLIALSAFGVGEKGQVFWSPYYKISYEPRSGDINTNNISHQTMHRIGEQAPAYSLAHLLNRDSGGAAFDDVLIIGAGSGNDVSAALKHGAKHVDAVEIDPAINRIGRWDHPDSPYADPRVSIRLDDGRSYLRRTDRSYDLAVYALVDSLVLHSGYSSIRLESFLFTRQALEDVKAKLKPGGVFAMYNYYRQGWVVGRLAKMAEEVFGTKPLVISLGYQETIRPTDSQQGYITFLLVSPDAQVIERLRQRFADSGSFWINERPALNAEMNGFGQAPPEGPGWQRIAPATVVTEGIGGLPTDDWPQLYLRDRTIPTHNLRGMAIIAVLSMLVLLVFVPPRRGRLRPNGQMFFLGAGFMLLETKGVVHMALLLGSTWLVNSVVFFAILVMILCANVFVQLARPKNLWPWYALLGAALLLNTLVPMSSFLALEGWMRTAVSCLVVFVPVFFAGVIFATAFRDSRDPAADFGSNVAGIILGGLSEYLSLVLGFNYLLGVAIAFYGLSALLRPRMAAASASIEPAPL